jgi:hypothetical protein
MKKVVGVVALLFSAACGVEQDPAEGGALVEATDRDVAAARLEQAVEAPKDLDTILREVGAIEKVSGDYTALCANYTYRRAGVIGCCNQTTRKYAMQICIYGAWYSSSAVSCVQDTSYCVCEPGTGPNCG